MTNLVILAAGPAKPNRNRHLELYNNTPIISRLINSLPTGDNFTPYVIVNKKNEELTKYLRLNHPTVSLLFPRDEKILSTFVEALRPSGDCRLICGDMLDLRPQVVESFARSPLISCSCKYSQPWGENFKSIKNSIIRRADVGDVIQKIGQQDKEEFLSPKIHARALELFYDFYPNGHQFVGLNPYEYNDIGTFTSFAFYESLWADPQRDESGPRGLIEINYPIYADND